MVFFSLYTSMTFQFYSSLFSIVSLGRNVARTFALAKVIVRQDSNRSPIHLKVKLDNSTDVEGKLDNVKLSYSLDKFKFDMILDDSFCRLYEWMIVGDNFSVSSLANNGFKPKWQMVK